MRDSEAFVSEQAALGRVWTLLGLTTDIPKDNDWIRCTLGGASVFVQRFGSTIRGFENVCRHRFYPIRTEAKGSGVIRCAFHHWVYNQDGKAVGIPQCKKLFGVSPKELGARLREVEIATCGVLMFGRFPRQQPTESEPATEADTSISGQDESLEAYLGQAWPILQSFCRPGIRPAFTSSDVKANWKLLYEITLEEYHAVAVHPTSFGKDGYLDPDEAYYPRFEPHSGFFHKGSSGDLMAMGRSCGTGDYRPDGYRVLNIFPNFLINHYQVLYIWYISLTQYIPIAVDLTIVRSWYYQAPFTGPNASWPRLLFWKWTDLWLTFFVGIYLKRITNEDHAICEAMHAPAGSNMEAPLLGLEEQRIAWFKEAYGEALAQANRPVNADTRSDER